jgi:hypothetical protein
VAKRHRRWIRLRPHVYICTTCGTGKIHAREGGAWVVTYHAPDGRSFTARQVPACEVGPKTAAALEKYAALITAGGVPKEHRHE